MYLISSVHKYNYMKNRHIGILSMFIGIFGGKRSSSIHEIYCLCNVFYSCLVI